MSLILIVLLSCTDYFFIYSRRPLADFRIHFIDKQFALLICLLDLFSFNPFVYLLRCFVFVFFCNKYGVYFIFPNFLFEVSALAQNVKCFVC